MFSVMIEVILIGVSGFCKSLLFSKRIHILKKCFASKITSSDLTLIKLILYPLQI